MHAAAKPDSSLRSTSPSPRLPRHITYLNTSAKQRNLQPQDTLSPNHEPKNSGDPIPSLQALQPNHSSSRSCANNDRGLRPRSHEELNVTVRGWIISTQSSHGERTFAQSRSMTARLSVRLGLSLGIEETFCRDEGWNMVCYIGVKLIGFIYVYGRA